MATKKTTKKATPGIKLSDLITARPHLEKLANKEMSGKAALEFAKFVREILVAIQEFDKGKRQDLLDKYCVEYESGKYEVAKENEKKFQDATTKALNAETKIKPFPISKLEIEISAAALVNMLPLFK